ncbi:MAG: hypothetical protein NC092_02915 [Butyrivibrio sp.]|nr:hypothetical protein [Muribaculum sp.]MCM1551624.1 hypothetical protein [Butyrivibrio sp.]
MVVRIEYYKGDVLLYGSKISFEEFKLQMKNIENLYDRQEDNFVALLCRVYHWSIMEDEMRAEYIYDRDVERCIRVH